MIFLLRSEKLAQFFLPPRLIARGVFLVWCSRRRPPRCFSRPRSPTSSIVGSPNRSLLRRSRLGRSRSPFWATLLISPRRSSGSWPTGGQSNMVRRVLDARWQAGADFLWPGGITYLHVVGQGLVFLNTPEATFDLMDKRGPIYSDKPHLVMLCELYVRSNLPGSRSHLARSKLRM